MRKEVDGQAQVSSATQQARTVFRGGLNCPISESHEALDGE
jgi:hypothetical protein